MKEGKYVMARCICGVRGRMDLYPCSPGPWRSVLGVLRVLQFAHGEIYMLGAYIVYYLISSRVNYFLALLLAGVAMFVLGMLLERVMFRRLRANMEPALLAAMGLSIVFQTGGAIKFYFLYQVYSGSGRSFRRRHFIWSPSGLDPHRYRAHQSGY